MYHPTIAPISGPSNQHTHRRSLTPNFRHPVPEKKTPRRLSIDQRKKNLRPNPPSKKKTRLASAPRAAPRSFARRKKPSKYYRISFPRRGILVIGRTIRKPPRRRRQRLIMHAMHCLRPRKFGRAWPCISRPYNISGAGSWPDRAYTLQPRGASIFERAIGSIRKLLGYLRSREVVSIVRYYWKGCVYLGEG